jgi:hypothetical protein
MPGVARTLTECVALTGIAVPVLSPSTAPSWAARALDLTIVIAALALASVRPGQPSYRYASSLLTIPAIACWLATLHVQLLEAHTWSGAVVLLPIGFAARRQRLSSRALSSWLAYGPGIALMLLPSTAIAITQSGVTRPACLAAVAIATVVAGVRWRLQAPIELGAVTLTILALDAAWPLLSEEPKWLTAGIAGLVLLWLGATAERRLDGARDFLGRLLHLD